jgi:hypothetical protein
VTNASDLIEDKGVISCPKLYLYPIGIMEVLHCLEICGAIFPVWKKKIDFHESGIKVGEGNCPCVYHGKPVTSNMFWKYFYEVMWNNTFL